MWRPDHPAQLVLGLTVWAIWFVLLYGGLSVGCALSPPDPQSGALNTLNALLMVLTLAASGLLLYWAWRCLKAASECGEGEANNRRLITRVSAGLHLFSAIATLGIGLPVVALPPCL